MVSIDGLLDTHEVSVRERVESLRAQVVRVTAELGEAELALEHVAITRATLAIVVTAAGAAAVPGQESEAAAGPSLVPVWRADLTGAHLPVGYRDLWRAVSGAPGPVRAQQLALDLGLQVTAAKVEGLRSKLKRLVARGWIAEPAPGTFAPVSTAPASPVAGS